MSSLPMASSFELGSKSSFDEHRWVIHIRRSLEEELEDDTDLPVCIFSIPKSLMAYKPESYIPQEVAIGPYNHWRPELYDMERYKLSAAKKVQTQLQNCKFHILVDQLTICESRIRACYHKYLDYTGETLAWMMAVDGSFLLEFLQVFAIKEGKTFTGVSSRLAHLVDYTGNKSAHNAILRDILLLENQIPLFVLKRIIEKQCSSIELAHDILNSMLIGLCKVMSPFNMQDNNFAFNQVMECAHLLDLLYNMIVPKSELPHEIDEIGDQSGRKDDEKRCFGKTSHVIQFFDKLWELLSKLNHGPIRWIKQVLLSRPLKLLAKLPWTIVTHLPGFAILKQPVQYFFSSKDDTKPEEGSSLKSEEKPPLIEEITIPSVTELHKAGVRFLPTTKDNPEINFDTKTVTLHLPTISLDVNTETVLRNLVAYEATKSSGLLVMARYTELMNGIIDTEEDANLLREKGIVLNRLKSDKEVADLWNGMSKSVKLTRVPVLDKVIEDVNKYYNGRWKGKLKKAIKIYVFGSWKFLTLLAAIFLLLLMTLQAFCSVYSCSRFFRISTSE